MTLKGNQNFKLIWGLVMVVIYLGMAFLMVFTNIFANMSLPIRIVCGILFLVYGIFRAYTLWRNGR